MSKKRSQIIVQDSGNFKLFAGIIIGAFASIGGLAIWKALLQNASVAGTVTNAATSLPLAGATVTVQGSDGFNKTVVTDPNGLYTIDGVRTSYIIEGYTYWYYYNFTVNMPGYNEFQQFNVIFHPAGNTFNIYLEAI